MQEKNHEHKHHDHHSHDHSSEHGHSHGLVDPSIVRSQAGVKAVSLSFLVLFVTAALQASVYLSSHSVALKKKKINTQHTQLTARLGFLLAKQKR